MGLFFCSTRKRCRQLTFLGRSIVFNPSKKVLMENLQPKKGICSTWQLMQVHTCKSMASSHVIRKKSIVCNGHKLVPTCSQVKSLSTKYFHKS